MKKILVFSSKIRRLVFCILLMSVLSCSSDDNNERSVEASLLYGGSWINVSQSSNLKEILFNKDMTYSQVVKFQPSVSQILTSINENSFGVIEGEFSIFEDQITFDTAEVISLGDTENTTSPIDESSIVNVVDGRPLGVFLGELLGGDVGNETEEIDPSLVSTPLVLIIETITEKELVVKNFGIIEKFTR